jgi:hypothetical protein
LDNKKPLGRFRDVLTGLGDKTSRDGSDETRKDQKEIVNLNEFKTISSRTQASALTVAEESKRDQDYKNESRTPSQRFASAVEYESSDNLKRVPK